MLLPPLLPGPDCTPDLLPVLLAHPTSVVPGWYGFAAGIACSVLPQVQYTQHTCSPCISRAGGASEGYNAMVQPTACCLLSLSQVGAGSGRQVYRIWPVQSPRQRQCMSRATPATTSASSALQQAASSASSPVPAGGQLHILHLWSCEHILITLLLCKR